MKAGALDREITIEQAAQTVDDAGSVVSTWTTLAPMRAQLVKNGASEQEHASGASTETTLTFRTWWLDGVSLANRITYQGQPFEIRDIQEIGRRRGLEITVKRVGP